uniref:Uncharacterized protein n=1 Tax=viral metagenome TaxID=1070528 RepID=A0A6C0DDN1_9ZZZZ
MATRKVKRAAATRKYKQKAGASSRVMNGLFKFFKSRRSLPKASSRANNIMMSPSRVPNSAMMVSPPPRMPTPLRRSERSRRAPVKAHGMLTHAEFSEEQKKVNQQIQKLTKEKRKLVKKGESTDEVDMKIDELTEMFGRL